MKQPATNRQKSIRNKCHTYVTLVLTQSYQPPNLKPNIIDNFANDDEG